MYDGASFLKERLSCKIVFPVALLCHVVFLRKKLVDGGIYVINRYAANLNYILVCNSAVFQTIAFSFLINLLHRQIFLFYPPDACVAVPEKTKVLCGGSLKFSDCHRAASLVDIGLSGLLIVGQVVLKNEIGMCILNKLNCQISVADGLLLSQQSVRCEWLND